MSTLAIVGAIAVLSYATLAIGYKGMQALYILRAGRSTHARCAAPRANWPSVDVIVPCYNEAPAILAACLRSLAAQDYPGTLRVYLVDDGSSNRDVVVPVHETWADDPRFAFVLLPRNVGKRKAQIAAIHRSTGELVINVDSDTVIAPDVVRKLVDAMADPTVGAAMGQLVARNRSATWLTRLIDMEYWIACNEERTAQAHFGAVMCCCGPCAIYRRSAIASVLEQYETQYFRGRRSDFGEDRHLTILMLMAGLRTVYVPDAIAATVVPERFGPYLLQQLRWARSTYRDSLLARRLLPRLDRYITVDTIGLQLGPLLLAFSVLTAFAQIALTATIPWCAIVVLTAMTVLRCGVVAWRARQLRFLGFTVHTFVNIFMLLPVKAWALLTLDNSNWLSRTTRATAPDEHKAQMPDAAYDGEIVVCSQAESTEPM
ncbi:chitooligosaccharide synthase NodC [Paraburkholderia terricola]|uniref:chitooligosaccharide synthase NodC n=1 Tax=Paraburkholderia terricola TaxID=169427 RepID=UPI00286A054A|nr:chitooligosaccharide synthase NodC [Paraburkholderia terricola]